MPSASAVGDLPVAVDDVMRVALAKHPARRPATAAGLLDALEDALDRDDYDVAAAPTAVTAPVATARPTMGSPRPQPLAARRRWPGLAALGALAVVVGAAIAIAAGGGGSGGDTGTTTHHASTRAAAKARPKTQTSQPAATQAPPAQAQTQPTEPQPPTTAQAQTDNPIALNNAGFALLQQGKPVEALAPLQRSVSAFRTQRRTGEIDYAYALYNLGNALRLSGHPGDAIPYLQERLKISSFKRGLVKKELQTAQKMA